jgi:hypothetical protein
MNLDQALLNLDPDLALVIKKLKIVEKVKTLFNAKTCYIAS